MNSDFVDETEVEFEIEGKKFVYKPITAGEENDRLDEYTYIKNNELKQDLRKLNEIKIRNIIAVPYSKEEINKIISIEKEWKELNQVQRWNLFKKLKPRVLTLIIRNINRIDAGDDVKKNSLN